MFGRRYVICCDDCSTEYKFKSGGAARAFYNACNGKCPNCGERLELWIPLMRHGITPPPELKSYPRDIRTVEMW